MVLFSFLTSFTLTFFFVYFTIIISTYHISIVIQFTIIVFSCLPKFHSYLYLSFTIFTCPPCELRLFHFLYKNVLICCFFVQSFPSLFLELYLQTSSFVYHLLTTPFWPSLTFTFQMYSFSSCLFLIIFFYLI